MSLPNPHKSHAVRKLPGLVTSDEEVSFIDDKTLEVVKLSYEGLDKCTRQTANVGGWYSSAVYWKWQALRAAGEPAQGIRERHIFNYAAEGHSATCSCGWTMQGVGQESGWNFFTKHLATLDAAAKKEQV